MERKTTSQLKQDYAKKVQQQRIDTALLSLSPKDRELMQVLAKLDDVSEGKLDEYYNLLTAIKNQPVN